jgi:hypothetical protein
VVCRTDAPTRATGPEFCEAQIEVQGALAAKYPGAEHITRTEAGHYSHLDNPQLVITSIRGLVDQVR